MPVQRKIVWNFPIILILLCHQDLRNLKIPTNQIGIQRNFIYITTDQDTFQTTQDGCSESMFWVSQENVCLLWHPHFSPYPSCSPTDNWPDSNHLKHLPSIKTPFTLQKKLISSNYTTPPCERTFTQNLVLPTSLGRAALSFLGLFPHQQLFKYFVWSKVTGLDHRSKNIKHFLS